MPWNFEGTLPIYTQLITRLKRAIIAGEYPPGSKLPSVRELAQEAGINPNTAQRALAELERDGLIYTQRTSGKFVTEETAVIENAKTQLACGQIVDFLSAMQALGFSADQTLELLQSAIKEEN